jgi:hypothetical protein
MVAVLIVAVVVGCYVFLAAIELDRGMVEEVSSTGVETPTKDLHVGNVADGYACFASHGPVE